MSLSCSTCEMKKQQNLKIYTISVYKNGFIYLFIYLEMCPRILLQTYADFCRKYTQR